MIHVRGGPPEELSGADQAIFNSGSLFGIPCFNPLEGGVCLPWVWAQGVLEIKAASVDLREV